jgi:hypothetical protein
VKISRRSFVLKIIFYFLYVCQGTSSTFYVRENGSLKIIEDIKPEDISNVAYWYCDSFEFNETSSFDQNEFWSGIEIAPNYQELINNMERSKKWVETEWASLMGSRYEITWRKPTAVIKGSEKDKLLRDSRLETDLESFSKTLSQNISRTKVFLMSPQRLSESYKNFSFQLQRSYNFLNNFKEDISRSSYSKLSSSMSSFKAEKRNGK